VPRPYAPCRKASSGRLGHVGQPLGHVGPPRRLVHVEIVEGRPFIGACRAAVGAFIVRLLLLLLLLLLLRRRRRLQHDVSSSLERGEGACVRERGDGPAREVTSPLFS
jgi:hypothetical protein